MLKRQVEKLIHGLDATAKTHISLRQASIAIMGRVTMKCKDCYWFSDITVKCCERDGSFPCDPESEQCSAFEQKDIVEERMKGGADD